MKRWIRIASRFYPATWRQRYAMEFNALLDEADAGWTDFFDTLKGALAMQFTSWNFKTIILTFALIGAAIGAVIAFSTHDRYASKSVVRMTATRGPFLLTPQHNAIQAIPMRGDRRTAAFLIRNVDSDPQRARAINRELLAIVQKQSVLALGARGARTLTSLQVVDQPSLPERPISPRRVEWVLMGLGGGLLIGTLVSLAQGWRISIVRRPAQ
jgi:LPS O-antigen subunit length determinant protein (WzzB/FepE family)